jgi:phosphoribosylanthranilate isomerase
MNVNDMKKNNIKENNIKLKICGLKRPEDIEIVNKYKPDYIGFVFTESKRQITFEKAQSLKNNLKNDILVVGVFVDSKIDYIKKFIRNNLIDIVQLHGNEDEEFISKLKEIDADIKVIKVIEISDNFMRDLKRWEESLVDYILLDSGKGSGKAFDWQLIGNIKKPFFLAGGINSENIKETFKFNPFAIDISSGAEYDGFKDSKKIAKIVNNMDTLNEMRQYG